ncbi:hypothetical protein [Mesorhizobium sp. INR15]|uniref:hypothetical protein n=1 Tax=Mesorhizobium sp. INR15 TaxID=2654248 RepID=UPI0018965523|nr:hypothetical protein [Mesorhizobium sp. INR15]QPC95405.1 hypothetical protein GA829_32785 [Mesorhizobium sp. INR15]
MTEKTSAELEHDAELARAKVSETADSIRNKMTPGQLIDEFSGMFTGDSGSLLTTLKGQVQGNPLPVALVGIGLAWLMAGQKAAPSVSEVPAARAPLAPDTRDAFNYSERLRGGADTSGGLAGTLADAATKVGSIVSDATEGITSTASDAAHQLSEKAKSVSNAASDPAIKAAGAAADLLRQEPLILAALGLAFGTAVGALLPHTDFEDQQVGPTSEKLRDQANQLFEQGVEGAKDVAAQAYQTVKDEADKQGLGGDGGDIVDKVTQVAKAAASKTEKAVREKLQDVSDKLPGTDA